MIAQLNVRVAKKFAADVAKEKALTGTTKDIIVEVALSDFFSRHPIERRKTFYRSHARQPYK
jgi:hypothetical protein